MRLEQSFSPLLYESWIAGVLGWWQEIKELVEKKRDVGKKPHNPDSPDKNTERRGDPKAKGGPGEKKKKDDEGEE